MAGLFKLSARKVETVQKVGRYGDGGGLYLEIRRPGSKVWTFRYMIAGRARYLGLGPLHTVSLVEARNRAREARQLILDGKDPIDVKHEARAARAVEQARTVTFRQAVDQFLSTSSKVQEFKNDKHRKQWRTTLDLVMPALGHLPLNQIDSELVLTALKPILERTPETASRLRARIARV